MATESRDEIRLRLLAAATMPEMEYGVPNRRIATFASWLEPNHPLGLLDVNEVVAIAADLLLEGDLRLTAWWLDIAAGVARVAMEPRPKSPFAGMTFEQAAATTATDRAIRIAQQQGRLTARVTQEATTNATPVLEPIPGYGSPAGYDFSQGRKATMSVDSLKAALDPPVQPKRKTTPKRSKSKRRVRK